MKRLRKKVERFTAPHGPYNLLLDIYIYVRIEGRIKNNDLLDTLKEYENTTRNNEMGEI